MSLERTNTAALSGFDSDSPSDDLAFGAVDKGHNAPQDPIVGKIFQIEATYAAVRHIVARGSSPGHGWVEVCWSRLIEG